MRTLLLCLAVGACAAEYRPLLAYSDDGRPDLLFRDVRVFTATGDGAVLEHQDVLVRAGRIRALAPTGTAMPPDGARVLSGEDLTVLPGLIDTHVHVLGTAAPPWRFRRPDPEHNLQAWLHAGVTTVMDMGGPPGMLNPLAEKAEQGELPAPRIVVGFIPFTAPGGHPVPAMRALLPWPLGAIVAGSTPQLDSPEVARAWVHKARAEGSPWVKIILDELPPGSPRLTPEVLEATVAEARAAGMRAFVHVASNADALLAARAGAHHLAHGVYKEPITDEVLQELRARNVSVTYTAAGFDVTRRLAEGKLQASALAREVASVPDEIEPTVLESGLAFGRDETLGPFARGIATNEVLRDNLRRLHAAGVRLLAGSDSPVVGVIPGASLHEELQLFEDAGIPPAQVLLTATSRAAALVGPAADFGTVAQGQRADLLVVRGDPTRSVRALQQIVHVVRDGRLVQRLAR